MPRAALRVAILLAMLAPLPLALWVATSEEAPRWLAARLEAASDARLRIEGVQGTLLGPLMAAKLTYTDAELTVVAERLEAAMQWRSLLRAALVLRELSALRVEITMGPSAGRPPQLPESVALPVPIEIRRLAIGRLAWRNGDDSAVIAPLAGEYAGGARVHRLTITRAGTPWGDLAANLALGAAAPFALDGTLHFAGTVPGAPLDVEAALEGNLQELRATLEAAAGELRAQGAATFSPLAADWLTQARLSLQGIDLARRLEGAPRTDARLELRLAGGASGVLRGHARLDNAVAGPLSAERVPLGSLGTEFAVQGGRVALEHLEADLGAAGRLRGSGEITVRGVRLDLAVTALDLRALHAQAHPTALSGTLHAEADAVAQKLAFELRDDGFEISGEAALAQEIITVPRFRAALHGGELRGSGQLALAAGRPFTLSVEARGFDPARLGDWPGAHLNGTLVAEGELAPAWRATVRARLADSRFGAVPLAGSAAFEVAPRALRQLTAEIRLGANRARLRGDFGRPGDTLEIAFTARELSQLDRRIAGRIAGTATLRGTVERPSGSLDARGGALAVDQRHRIGTLRARGSISDDAERRFELQLEVEDVNLPQAQLRQARVTVSGRETSHEVIAEAKGAGIDARLRAVGGWHGDDGWRGSVHEIVNRGAYRVQLAAPATLEARRGRVVLGPAVLAVLGGELALAALRLDQDRLESRGRVRAFPVAPLAALGGWHMPDGSDLSLNGEWAIVSAPRMSGTLRLERAAGDVVLSPERGLAAGLDALVLEARIADDVADLRGALSTARRDSARLTARIAPAPGSTAGPFAREARVDGTLDAELASLAAVQELIGGAAAIGGRARARLVITGSLAAPVITGTANAEDVRVDMPQHGLALRQGSARVRLDEQALRVEALQIRGPEGELRASGELPRGGGDASLVWRAERLRVFNRPDRQLTVSGGGDALLSAERLTLRGELVADLGVIELPDRATGGVGDDVVVLGREAARAKAARRTPPLALDVVLDAGERFSVRAQGLEAGLRGRLRLQSRVDGEIGARGSIETRGGTYRAFGQRLAIERGRLLFDGAVDNPALDVLALRKNQAVEAGVQVSGTVRSPVVRLVSKPPVPDQEKLSWLIFGHGAAGSAGPEQALLQGAMAALAGATESGGAGGAFARGLGVDEIGLRSGAAGPAVAVGKRLTERIRLEYEQGLTAAAALVRLRYALTQTLNLIAEASGQGGRIGIGYDKSYD